MIEQKYVDYFGNSLKSLFHIRCKSEIFHKILVLGISTTIIGGCDNEAKTPNVVFILADDLGWAQTSAYGSDYYHTPNIDRLAVEGIRFTNAYAAAAVCSPTRASIMTGKYPARLHLTDFIAGNKRDIYPLTQPDWQKHLPLHEYTLGELFKDHDYRTASFGKWHLSPESTGPESLPYNPDKQGFDEYFIIGKPTKVTDPEDDPHGSDSIGHNAIEFIRKNAGQPFFLYAAFSAIHNPLVERSDSIASWQKVEGSDRPENNPVIGAMLSRLDRNIGKILSVLDELELADNTIVVFYSDNGGLEKDADQALLRKGKGWLYEGGIRVPLIIRWPGSIDPGRVSSQIVSSIDFMPTFCEILEQEPPQNIDGISLLDHLKSEELLPGRDIFWHYPHYHSGSDMVPAGAIRKGNWKLIEWYEKSLLYSGESAFELYDLENDLGETVNLADSLNSITMKLAGDLKRWRDNTDVQMPVPNTK